jgi:3-methylcrotonyl-CoA carboxylase alpha subunit
MLSTGEGGSLGDAVSPMPGVIEKVTVTPGTSVEKGDPLVIMIAMKMEVSDKSSDVQLNDHYYSCINTH